MGGFSNNGLCESCVFKKLIVSDKGSSFLQCRKAFEDARFAKYPRLPVLQCSGYQKAD